MNTIPRQSPGFGSVCLLLISLVAVSMCTGVRGQVSNRKIRPSGQREPLDRIKPPTYEPASQDVEVAVRVYKNGSPIDWMEVDPNSIRVKTVTVGPGTRDLADLLRENKTVPDNFAFSYIMDLNPGIVDLDYIKQGDVIKLPIIYKPYVRGSFAYAVANSLSQHRELDENVQAFSSKSGEVLAEKTMFSEPSDRIRYEKLATRYSKTIDALRKLPINSSTRQRVIGNSETAVKLLQMASGSKSIDTLTLDTLESLSFEVETISAEAEDRANQFQVNVAVTVNGIPRPPKEDFRVVCKVESKFREDLIKGDAYSPKTSIRFYNLVDKDGLSSKLLSDDTNYYFWVERERDRKVISPPPETPFTVKKEHNCPEALKDRYQLCIALSTTSPN